METFVASRDKFNRLLNQSGGSIDRYIYKQSGNGLANFFSKVFRYAKPLLSSAINTVKPELKSIGEKVIDSGSKAAVSKIEKLRDQGKQRIKRKRDNLDNVKV